MLRKLLATTALASVVATGAFAQSTATDADMGTSIFNRDTTIYSETDASGYFEADATEILASSLLGKPIYNGSSDDAETIGDVNDVLMTSDGSAKAIVVGVGGFLGIGEKEVAVDFSRVTWVNKGDERRLVINATTEELESAPAFDRSTIDPAYDMSMPGADTSEAMPNTGTEMPDDAVTATEGTPLVTAPEGADANAMDNASTMDSTTALDLEGQDLVDYTALTADDILGARVYDDMGNDMGEVSDALLSEDGKTIEAYVLDIGGFLGIGEKPVALAADSLQVSRDGNGVLSVHTSFTEEELKDRPSYSESEYAQNPDAILIR